MCGTRGGGGSHTQSHVLQLPGKGPGCTQLSPLARRPPTPETPPLETPSCLRLAGVRTTHAQTGSDFEVAVSKLKVQFFKKTSLTYGVTFLILKLTSELLGAWLRKEFSVGHGRIGTLVSQQK